jgi:hypothetical protein
MRTATRLVAPVVLGLLFALSAVTQHSAEAARGAKSAKAAKSNMSQTRYSGKRRLSRAANGAGSSFMNKDRGLVASLGGKPITNRRVKVTKLGVKQSATSTNHRYRVETIAKVGGKPAASTEVVVADFAVKGPKGGRAKEARFFQRKNPRLTKATDSRRSRRTSR